MISSAGCLGDAMATDSSLASCFLEVDEQPPPHVFANEWFDVKISLRYDFEKCSNPFIGGGHLRILPEVFLNDDALIRERANRDIVDIIVDPSTPLMINLEQGAGAKMSTILRCKLKASIKSDSLVSVCINFSPENSTQGKFKFPDQLTWQ